MDYDMTGGKGGGGSVLFGTGEGITVNGTTDMYEGLDKNGSPVVLQAEMNNAAGGGGGGGKKKGGRH